MEEKMEGKMKKDGVWLAALFSWGCKRAEELKINSILKNFSENPTDEKDEKRKVKECLKKLLPYPFYVGIARSNAIKDPFQWDVVYAYWIGNSLLERVKKKIIEQVLEEFKEDFDPLELTFAALPIILKGEYCHHNASVRQNAKCSVTLKKGWLWHLGIKRLKAGEKEIENFKKYASRKKV